MPNGFHGPEEKWREMEAPYILIDPIITAFARRHALGIRKNYRDADRSIVWNDPLNRTIWIGLTLAEGRPYEVSAMAFQDRPAGRFIKAGIVEYAITAEQLDSALEHARRHLLSWTPEDLHLARGREDTPDLPPMP
jgi:hypothetical protein